MNNYKDIIDVFIRNAALEEEIMDVRNEKEKAVRKQDFEAAAISREAEVFALKRYKENLKVIKKLHAERYEETEIKPVIYEIDLGILEGLQAQHPVLAKYELKELLDIIVLLNDNHVVTTIAKHEQL